MRQEDMSNAAPDKPSMYCRQCQYVLDGLPDNRCPECGTEFEPTDPATFWLAPKPPWRWEAFASLACLIVAFLWIWMDLADLKSWPSPVSYYLPPVFSLGFGLGFGVSGCRRGRRASRILSAVVLLLLLLLTPEMLSRLF